jgi:RNA binding exosome subunit
LSVSIHSTSTVSFARFFALRPSSVVVKEFFHTLRGEHVNQQFGYFGNPATVIRAHLADEFNRRVLNAPDKLCG